jgi:hypothetical protein
MSETIKGLFVAEFDYDATSGEELGVREGQWLFLLDDSDADWFKVRLKLEPGVDADASQQGLVPASYLSPARATGTAKANYGFEASNTEELTVVEDEELLLYANEEDWALVGRAHGEGVGYVPASYLEVSLSYLKSRTPMLFDRPTPKLPRKIKSNHRITKSPHMLVFLWQTVNPPEHARSTKNLNPPKRLDPLQQHQRRPLLHHPSIQNATTALAKSRPGPPPPSTLPAPTARRPPAARAPSASATAPSSLPPSPTRAPYSRLRWPC